MKRIAITGLALVLAICFALPAFSAISTPIVRINLTKATVITQEELDSKVALYKQAYGDSVETATVLEAMVSDIVLAQALERDGFVLTEDAKDELLASQKASIEQQLGQALTDEQFAYVVQQNYGGTVSDLREYLAQQYTIQAYVKAKKGDMFTEANTTPTRQQVEDAYKKNRSSFISPENVKLSHVFFNLGDGQQTKALNVLNQIKSGKLTFEKAVTQYSEDEDSKTSAGEIGWLSISDSDTMSYMGENFFDKVFALEAGEVSDVIESLAGYHIVKVTVHNQAKILDIDDKISPTDSATVRDYIAANLSQQMVSAVFNEAYLSLINDLKGQASIKYLTSVVK